MDGSERARRSLSAMEARLAGAPEEERDRLIQVLAADPRSGARSLAHKYSRKGRASVELTAGFRRLGELERRLAEVGYANVGGADEVGRGALAGPLVAAATIMPLEFEDVRLRESKQLSPALRQELYDVITQNALAWYVVSVDPREIDAQGIQAANKRALREAILGMRLVPDFVVVDAFELPGLGIPHLGLKKGDTMSLSVAAASVLAKVTRDRIMVELAGEYPRFRFDQNKGYGTVEHRMAIEEHGPCPVHRRSFAPSSGQLNLGIGGWG